MAGRTASRAWAGQGRWVVVERAGIGAWVGSGGAVHWTVGGGGDAGGRARFGVGGSGGAQACGEAGKVGWCERMPAIRGDGMLVWLTPSGLDGRWARRATSAPLPGPVLTPDPALHPRCVGRR
jgi:hypothetical protein